MEAPDHHGTLFSHYPSNSGWSVDNTLEAKGGKQFSHDDLGWLYLNHIRGRVKNQVLNNVPGCSFVPLTAF